MVSVKGISVKNIVNFKGHEGEPLVQCDVCYQGKKVAEYSQDSWGGEDRFDFDYDLPKEKRQELTAIFERSAKEFLQERLDRGESIEFYAENPEYYDYRVLILDIIELKDIEKLYKKILKDNKDTMLVFMKDRFTMNTLSWKHNDIYTLNYVCKLKKIDKGQVRYFIQSEKDFEIK